MKKKLMKLLSMLMAIVMVLGMACTSLAATSSDEGTKFTITITGAAVGETYSAYKIFNVTYDYDSKDDEYNYSYTMDATCAWLNNDDYANPYVYGDENGDIFTLEETTVSGVYNVIVNPDATEDQIIAVFTQNGLPDQAWTAASEKAESDEVTLDVTNAGAGYYYVTTSLGSLVIIDTTNPNPEIPEKNGFPTVSKYVHENTDPDDTWGHEDDANNNEDITFQIHIDNVNGATNLVLHDSMDDELQLIMDETDGKFHLSSATLYKTEDDTGVALVEDTDYTITTGTCTVNGCDIENCAFEIHFNDSLFEYKENEEEQVDDTGYIVLTYKLHLDTDNDAYSEDYEEFDNEAQVSFGTTSFSIVVQAETFSFGFETFKYTGTDQTPLEGVQFVLVDSDEEDAASAWFKEEEVEGKTIYLFEGWDRDLSDTTDLTQTLVTASDGMIYVEGLDTGDYYLVETKALDGYNMLTGPVTVTITAEYDPDTGEMLTHTVTYTYGDESGTGIVNIENNAGKILPGTGGMGTTLFYIVGVVLILGAAVLFVTKKRLDREEQ